MSKLVVQYLRHCVRHVPDEAAGQPDAQLLRQFIDANDHRAFEIPLDRHGPMVLGTARRLVNNAADADDVFQAVFLSLARLAKSIRKGHSVPNWLYTTTCRIAARARKRRAASIENEPEPSTANTAESDLAWREVRTALDEVLATASRDKTVKVWDAEKGQELLTLKGHTGLMRCVCFSPDGKRVASASNDKTVKVWSLDKKQ
jgi:RNA polymerase sigma factor (sigma-70 family)